ncbi:ABC transporter permease [Micrococcus flavus]|uniref:D-methionine transport system permease protein n=1 Tax=Micrococcus flavus TaxID=384602 RepID=A0A4Y8X631_9MICC|nr:methionine ABC transporter permease [Micrococcus flavus]MBB4882801.1 D-methionine transport system permease protein [Micrococcus flavus]TFI04252.1 ABC transporter permease [Micrococcus flavus]GGK40231.1 putative ABC-type transporter, permease component [Micrococcus flavus]
MIQDVQNLDWGYYGPELLMAMGDTIYMVFWAFLIGGLLGLLLGFVLYTTRPGGIFAHRAVNLVVNFVVNLIRPIPFVILIAALQPLTISVVGTGIGNTAVVFCMIWASTFGIARIVEQNLVSLDPGVIEAARAMGASRWRIVTSVMLPEALGPLILGYTFVIISLVDMSALAGIIGGGGIGNFAIVEGYNRFRPEVTWMAVIVVILFVQALQLIGNWAARKVMRR